LLAKREKGVPQRRSTISSIPANMQSALLQMANAHIAMAEALRGIVQNQGSGGVQDVAMAFGINAAAGEGGEGIKKVPKVKKEKKPRKPRNITGYNLFMRDRMKTMKADDGKGGKALEGGESLLKIIGAQWKELGDGQQAYLQQAKMLAEGASTGENLDFLARLAASKGRPEGAGEDHADDDAASDEDADSDQGKDAGKDDDSSDDSSDDEERKKEKERKEKKKEKKEKKHKRKDKDDDGEKKKKKKSKHDKDD